MAEESLRQKTFVGVIWGYVNHFGTQIISIVPAMVLTRLLSPSEYGLIAMASIFNGVAFQLSTGGFTDALLQKKEPSQTDCSSVYYFNILINSFLYIVFFFLAPLGADFFENDQLTSIIRVTLLNLPFCALGGVHAILLKKALNFKAPAIRNVIVQSISAIVAIVMAFYGFGVWALVAQGLLQTLGNAIFNWIMCSWRPTIEMSFNSLKGMFGYGFKIYLSGIINYVFGKATDTTIAKVYSAADLSYYNRAYSTSNIFSSTFLGVINGVAFPVFAKIQGEKVRIKNNASKFMKIACMAIFYVMIVVGVLAEPFMNFMYSSKWNAVIPYFQIVCIWAIFQPIRNIQENILRATGCAGIILYNRILNKIFTLFLVFLVWKFNIYYMLWGQIVLEFMEIFVFSHFMTKFYSYGVKQIVPDVLPSLIISVVIGGIVFLSDWSIRLVLDGFIDSEMLYSFIRLAFSGIISLILFFIIYSKLHIDAFVDLLNLIIDNIGGKESKIGRFLFWFID